MTKRRKEQTTLSVKLTASEYKANYDASCKQLLSEKQILTRIMKATLKEYKHLSIPKIMACIEGKPMIGIEAVFPNSKTSVIRGENTEDTSIDEGTIRFDIKFRALVPGTDEFTEIIINVEAQNKFRQDYPIVTRAIYYGSRMLSSQYGTEFKNSEYGKIKKVASIWICTNPPKERRNTINRYWLNEEQMVGQAAEEKKNYDLLDVVLVCLGGPNQDHYNDLIKMLDVLLSKTISHEDKRQILETEFEIKMTEELEEGLDAMCNLSQGIEDEAKKKAKKKTKKKQDLRHIKLLMKNMNLTVTEAMNLLEIPVNKQKKYEKLISS